MIEELDRILSIGNVVEESIAKQTLHSGRLRQAILSTAFEGKLVDQDPADEPADVLLDRIRAERAATVCALPKAKRFRKLKAAS
jgi:type I restriction enzyme S subunit